MPGSIRGLTPPARRGFHNRPLSLGCKWFVEIDSLRQTSKSATHYPLPGRLCEKRVAEEVVATHWPTLLARTTIDLLNVQANRGAGGSPNLWPWIIIGNPGQNPP